MEKKYATACVNEMVKLKILDFLSNLLKFIAKDNVLELIITENIIAGHSSEVFIFLKLHYLKTRILRYKAL